MVANRCGTVLWFASLAVLAVAACGGSTAPASPGDAGGREAHGGDGAPLEDTGSDAARDGAADASYLACFNANGRLDASIKACQVDGDCLIKQEQTDCCGSLLEVGVNAMYAGTFAACEDAWVAHFPGCGCASGTTLTEDGKTSTPGSDAGPPQVRCTDFTTSGGVCLTFTP